MSETSSTSSGGGKQSDAGDMQTGKKRGRYSAWLSQPPTSLVAKMPRTTQWRESNNISTSQFSSSSTPTTSTTCSSSTDTSSQQSRIDFAKQFFADLESDNTCSSSSSLCPSTCRDHVDRHQYHAHDIDSEHPISSETQSGNTMAEDCLDDDPECDGGIRFTADIDEHEVDLRAHVIADSPLFESDLEQYCSRLLVEQIEQEAEDPNLKDSQNVEELVGDNANESLQSLPEECECEEEPQPPHDPEEALESEDDEADADGASHIDDDKPLYKEARISVGTHMLLLMAFIVRHGLSGAAILDLLTLVEIHCVTYNLCQTSLRLFHRYFDNCKTPVEKHFYCANPKCCTYFGKENKEKCGDCETLTDTKSPAYFFVSPLSGALHSFFKRENFTEQLKYPMRRKKQDPSAIEDVYDGKVYRERFCEDGYFTGTAEEDKARQIHISFQLNTDGVALFKSSKYSVWPVFFVINELHPKLRYSREFRILAGMWFGQSKPHFSTFMKPFAEILNSLYNDGVQVQLPSGEKRQVRGIVISAVFDSPARCLFQNFLQFNGKHGCAYCKEKGVGVKTSERGQTQTYPFNVEAQDTGFANPRTHKETVSYAEEADKIKSPVMGVKGTSPFLFVPYFDVIRCVAPDYMHGVMLGVIKLFVDLWFDVSYRCSKWSIRSHLKEVDERLSKIRPPNFISRPPQDIQTHIKWWKASEYRSFLLFYSVPCLYGILPSAYFDHLLLLVNSLHILLNNSITKAKLEQARAMLKLFVLQIKDLYHPRYYTWNAHSLLHYVTSVEDLGPLFLLSCFWYEDFNGDLRHMFHGTRGVGLQVLTAIAISQKIPLLANRLIYGTLEFEIYNHMSKRSKFERVKKTEYISSTKCIVGVFGLLSQKYIATIIRKIGEVSEIRSFKCILLSSRLLQCKLYTRVVKRSNYTITYKSNDRACSVLIGNVIVYIKCRRKCPNITFCTDKCICKDMFYGALIEPLKIIDSFSFTSGKPVNSLTRKVIVPVVESGEVEVIPVNNIISQCILIDISHKEYFVGIPPNMHEKD